MTVWKFYVFDSSTVPSIESTLSPDDSLFDDSFIKEKSEKHYELEIEDNGSIEDALKKFSAEIVHDNFTDYSNFAEFFRELLDRNSISMYVTPMDETDMSGLKNRGQTFNHRELIDTFQEYLNKRKRVAIRKEIDTKLSLIDL